MTALDDCTTGAEVEEAEDETGDEVTAALEVEDGTVDDGAVEDGAEDDTEEDTAGDDVEDEAAVDDEANGALLDEDTAGGAELTPEPVTANAKVASVVAVLYSVT